MENWKSVSGYEGFYEVSDLGNVKSCDRTVEVKKCERYRNGFTKVQKGRLLKQWESRGYKHVTLHKDGNPVQFQVHRLVAKEFVVNDDPHLKIQVNHKDGNKGNNKSENLEWVTPRENTRHMCKVLGKSGRKLTEEQAEAIRKDKRSSRKIAKDYGVSHTTVNFIKKSASYSF